MQLSTCKLFSRTADLAQWNELAEQINRSGLLSRSAYVAFHSIILRLVSTSVVIEVLLRCGVGFRTKPIEGFGELVTLRSRDA